MQTLGIGKVYKFWSLLLGFVAFCVLLFGLLYHSEGMYACRGIAVAIAILCVVLIASILLSARGGAIPPKVIALPAQVIVLIFYLPLILIVAGITLFSTRRSDQTADYIIILGAKVNGLEPSRILRYRIESATTYLRAHPETIAIASGGQGPDERISEAVCMRQELEKAGISGDRIWLEDRSINTRQNLLNAKSMILSRSTHQANNEQNPSFSTASVTEPTIAIATTDFHMFRAIHMAKSVGFSSVLPVSSKTVWWLIPTNYTREFFAILKFLLTSALPTKT